MDSNLGNSWWLLVLSQPAGNGTLRMRIWREVKALGAALLRDGVYLLPATAAAQQAFAALASAVQQGGGQSHLLLATTEAEQSKQWQAWFDRAADYAELLVALHKSQRQLARTRHVETMRQQQQVLLSRFTAIERIDYFPGAAHRQLQQALADLARLIDSLATPNEPSSKRGRIKQITSEGRSRYQGQVWATRERLWIDRVASAWLIKRFIDPHARFVWLKKPVDKPKRAIGFDFDGAEFSHQQQRVTFEVLLESFALSQDLALLRLGHIVHTLDAGGAALPEVAGFAALLTGLRQLHQDDNDFLIATSQALDGWYAAFASQVQEAAPGVQSVTQEAAPQSTKQSAQQTARAIGRPINQRAMTDATNAAPASTTKKRSVKTASRVRSPA